MFGSVILDVAVGLVIIYLLLSLVATSIREWIASLLNTRAKTLHDGLVELLEDKQLVVDLYNHPVIVTLYRGQNYDEALAKNQLPSYIPSRSFSSALIDMLVRGRDSTNRLQAGSEAREITVQSVREQVGRIGNVRVQRAVLAAADASRGDLDALYANVDRWFDSTMERVSGWYKRRSQLYLFFIGLALTALANADSVRIAKRLYTDPSARQTAIALAASLKSSDTLMLAHGAPDSARAEALRRTARQLDSLDVPLYGWSALDDPRYRSVGDKFTAVWDTLSFPVLLGWLITALAVSLGASFWFDTLSRVMVIRSTVKPVRITPSEALAEQQAGDRAVVTVTREGAGSPPAAQARSGAPPADATSAAPPPDFTAQEWAVGHPAAGVL